MTLSAKPKAPNTIQHKKRSGAHHTRSKSYTKPYWPYLPLLLIVGLGLIFNSVWSSHTHRVLGDATNLSATELLTDTNAQRTHDHESSLDLNNRLTAAAQAKANDMVTRNYWSHDTPDGKTPWTFITAAHYNYLVAGENLAYGFSDSSSVITAWMNSAEHRANILNGNFTNVGFGVATSKDYHNSGPQTVIVAMYAEPSNASVAVSPASNTQSPASLAANQNAAVTLSQPSAQRIARVQDLTPSNASWTLFVISLLATTSLIWFVLRHALAWKRVLVHSEEFILHHRFLDVIIVSVAVCGLLLTRTAGFIH